MIGNAGSADAGSLQGEAKREVEKNISDAEVAPDEIEKAIKLASHATQKESLPALNRGRPRRVKLLKAEDELSMSAVKKRDRAQDIRLKRLLAWFAIVAVALQLLIADLLFYNYIEHLGYRASDSVMVAWLSATVVEVIGIVAIIARNLFPNRSATRGRQENG